MKEFNWEEFKDINNKIVVHCKTEEEAKDFCRQMHEHGMKWCDGDSFLEKINFNTWKSKTCYYNNGRFSIVEHAKEYGYKILEWSDYMKKEFTKTDLRDGMVVEYKNGKRRLVIADMLIGKDGYLTLESFRQNLENIKFMEHTIVKIYKIKDAITLNHIFDDYNLELIWERTKIKRMTVEEMRQKLEELIGEKIEVELSDDK